MNMIVADSEPRSSVRLNGVAPHEDDVVYATLLPAFDVPFYLASNLDVAASEVDPVLHYIRYGASEGRDPTAQFSTREYTRANSHLIHSGINPFYHFLVSETKSNAPSVAASLQRNIVKSPIDPPDIVQEKLAYTLKQPLFGLQKQCFDSDETLFSCVIGDRHALTHNTTHYHDLLL